MGRECLGLAPSAQLKTDLRGHPSLSAPGGSPRPPPMSPATPSLSSCKWRSKAHSLSQSPPALGETPPASRMLVPLPPLPCYLLAPCHLSAPVPLPPGRPLGLPLFPLQSGSCHHCHRRQPTRLRHPWDSPGKNTGVGCHFLLQCMKVKVKSLSRV